jgi:hypothetical protein
MSVFTPLPRLWPGATVVLIGSGPSLHDDDVALVQRTRQLGLHMAVIVVNDAYRKAPWADAIFAADAIWWQWQAQEPDSAFPPIRIAVQPDAQQYREHIWLVDRGGATGLDNRPTHVRSGGHSGYMAINAAVHLAGAGSHFILLGYDMQPGDDGQHHFFGEHPNGAKLHYEQRLGVYKDLPAHLRARGITIVNATRRTAITTLPPATLAEALTVV